MLARSHAYQSGSGSFTNHNFSHADGNGNITYLVNSSQGLAASYRYDPYGNTISSSGSLASGNVYRFSSKEIHVNSGLYYYGYRWYAPNLQRWLNADPLADGGSIVYATKQIGLNTLPDRMTTDRNETQDTVVNVEEVEGPNVFAYVNNSPTGYWDAFGLAKGGKQNIACEEFTKKSDPDEVKKAMNPAKAAKQTKRYRALRALL